MAPKKAATDQPRLKALYRSDIRRKLMKERGYSNPMQVPRLEKIVLNMGVGEAAANKKALEGAMADLELIAGQKPVPTQARRSEASFKIRDGMRIGCKVTLRGNRMYEFLDRLITIALPRVRDFRGLSRKAFDGLGNYNLGIREQIVFPEIDYDNIDKIRGLNVTIVTNATNDDEGAALLESFNLPLHKPEQQQG